MEEKGVVLYEAEKAVVQNKRGGYELTSPFNELSTVLKRGSDFGLIPKTKKPTLYKAGAEKICLLYGLFAHYEIESKIEDHGENPFFFYNVKCNLVKVNPADGREYIFASAYGSSNTGESKNGFAGVYNSANTALKMAQVRALRAAALSIGGLSDIFDQDIENESFMENAQEIYASTDENAKVSAKQIKRLYAIAGDAGLNPEQAKNKIIAMGFASTKDITQKDYDRICEELAKG